MRSAVQILLISAVLLIAGCGGVAGVNPGNNPTPATSSVKVKWESDGNDGKVTSDGTRSPDVPVCHSELKNCKQSLVVVDATTGETHTISLPLTTFDYTFNKVKETDVFNAYVTGFNGKGEAIKSPAAVWHE